VQAADTGLHATNAAKTEQIALTVSNISTTAYTLTLKEDTTTVLVQEIEAMSGEVVIYNNVISGAAVTLYASTTAANKLFIRADINQRG
jgi:hypothetical protein